MNLFSEQFILFAVIVLFVILVSIQYTLNKILRILVEIKNKPRT